MMYNHGGKKEMLCYPTFHLQSKDPFLLHSEISEPFMIFSDLLDTYYHLDPGPSKNYTRKLNTFCRHIRLYLCLNNF